MIRSTPYHKQLVPAQTLAEEIQRREAAYQEWLANKQRYQKEQQHEYLDTDHPSD